MQHAAGLDAQAKARLAAHPASWHWPAFSARSCLARPYSARSCRRHSWRQALVRAAVTLRSARLVSRRAPWGAGICPRPGKIIGAARGRRKRLAVGEHLRCNRIGLPLRRVIARTEEVAALPTTGRGKWNDWPNRGSCVPLRLLFRTRQSHRHNMAGHDPAQFMLDIMSKLLRADLGEIHAIDKCAAGESDLRNPAPARRNCLCRRRSRPRHRHK